MAIITRWHMPPDSSNGIGVVAALRVGDADPRQRLDGALRRVAARVAAAWRSSTSSIWWPTLRIGLSAVRGLWKIIDDLAAADRAQSLAGVAVSRSMPPKRDAAAA